MIFRKHKVLFAMTGLVAIASLFIYSTHSNTVDFNTQVKPIINKHCISCHGGVKQQGNFSLLFRNEALQITKSGKYGIVPGDAGRSEMIRRLTLKDPDERMPYRHPPLAQKEIDILTAWVNKGAAWGNHWAYISVTEPTIPGPERRFMGLMPGKQWDWVHNNIDAFIYQKLKVQGLEPSPEADKATLARRVSFDLIGLPPSPQLVQQFLNNKAPNAYEQLVDSLLASPHYGEHMTATWLDLARYADTKGYERDDHRNIWRYRDWLINAFNKDLPYNQFLTEQLAGDLLPDATDDQLVATAFHRNTMTNDEGGTDNEEFRTEAVIDRVNTTWQGLMGTTFACVQCHSHPYDPFKHEDYYKFLAFFNNTRDEDTYADFPLLRHYNSKDSLKLVQLTTWLNNNDFKQEGKEIYQFLKTGQPSINSIAADSFTKSELSDTKWLVFQNNAIARLKSVDLSGKSRLTYRYKGLAPGGVFTIRLDAPDGPILKSIPVIGTKDWALNTVDFNPVQGVHNLFLTYNNPALTKPDANGMMFEWFYFTQPFPGKEKEGYAKAVETYWQLVNASVTTTPVIVENPSGMQRTTYVFDKGNRLTPGAIVTPDVPASLNPFPNKAPRNRLGLAQWLTSTQNPLTARTLVNRLWQNVFGTGLVETLEDMGTQGADPTHKELLDYLAWQLMHRDGWQVKKLLKEIVMSSTYRQSAIVNKELLDKDPYNKWYARGPRVRLSAEQIRDQALAASGLLSKKMLGPSVMPWQPDGIWLSPWSGQYWVKSSGEDQYRRAVYTYWKRTAPYPSTISFDGANREVCAVRRIVTNTPLQALTTLNDSVYLDAAQHLAYRMQKEGAGDIKAQIDYGYRLLLFKPITPQRLEPLYKLYNKAYGQFKNKPEGAKVFIGNTKDNDNAGTAALVVVANALLNIDEVIVKN